MVKKCFIKETSVLLSLTLIVSSFVALAATNTGFSTSSKMEQILWIKITTPINGSFVKMSLVIQANGSSDIDEVMYSFCADFRGDGNYLWSGGVNWTTYTPPYQLMVNFSLPHNSTLTILAYAYKYSESDNCYLITRSNLVTVKII